MRRPTGLIFIALALGLVALAELFAGAGTFASAVIMRRTLSAGADPGQIGPGTYPPGPAPSPAFVETLTLALAIAIILLAVWAVVSAIGLLRRKNWARISTLIQGGGMACLGLLSTAGVLLVLLAGPGLGIPPPANAPPPDIMRTIFLGVAVFYLFIAGLGIWWLVYLNRTSVRTWFVPQRPLSLSDAHIPGLSFSPSHRQPHVPVTIAILAGLFFVSAASCALVALTPLPAFLLGLLLTGWKARLLYGSLALASAAIGFGLLRLSNRARLLTIALLCFGLINIGMLALPWYQRKLDTYQALIYQQMGLRGAMPSHLSTRPTMLLMSGLSLPVYAIFLYLLVRHRSVFRPGQSPSGMQPPPPPATSLPL